MDEPTGKHCTGCGEVKPLEEFTRDRRRPDGLSRRCRACRSQYHRERYAANPEAAREATRRWRGANPEAWKESRRQSMRRWVAANPEAAQEHGRRWRESYRNRVFDHYGRQCACCGATERLTIDHIDGDGGQHREEIGKGSGAIHRWLIANGFPPGFQVLCVACNTSKWTSDRCRLNHGSA